jgi:D-alanyl-lipoteichoic acid acyltransferase DltB (MBOAT superfamily)
MFFFPVVLALYFIIPKKLRSIWLLIASYYFYMSWNATYALLIGGSTLATYVSGALMDHFNNSTEDKGSVRRKNIAVMAICIVANLAILALFKYGNFAIESLNILLNLLHISVIQTRFNLLLPVGISFYTFQALGYIIDVYRGDVKAEKNLLRYALFVSFFPQLVAGPIERSKSLLTQMKHIEEIKLWNAKRVASGAIMMVWGYFMKMMIADRAALLVDTVYNDYASYHGTELLVAMVLFAIQIYCDFGGYSCMAIGAAKIMGFDLMENFNAPYFARSIRDFWSRWHISLSTWFRDYLYIPLGGNRKGMRRKYINLMIVFLVSGLWHGASWTFVLWGGIHGFYQIAGGILAKPKKILIEKANVRTDCLSYKFLQTAITFGLVTAAWNFFRADSIIAALKIIKHVFTQASPWIFFDGTLYELGLDRTEMNILIVSIVILLLVDLVRYNLKQTLDEFLMDQNLWFEWAVVIGLIVMIFVYGEYGVTFDPQQFIYFQF